MITVTTHQYKDIDANCSSFQDNIIIDYATLVELFGEPELLICDKVDAEWILEFTDHDTNEVTMATIYNYKNGQSYLGSGAVKTQNIVEWNIGGFSKRSAELVKQFIEER